LVTAAIAGATIFFASGSARADEAPLDEAPDAFTATSGRMVVAYESRTEKQRRADEQYEYEEGQELEEGEHVDAESSGGRRGGGGPSQRTVGMALGISGLIVGLTGGAITLAGSVANDEPTLITGAVIGLVGSALGISGLIVGITAPGAQASTQPTYFFAASPTGLGFGGTF
jgi:hypothetical protein